MTAQRLAAATTWFWMIRGLFAEATEQMAAACALDGPVPQAVAALCTAYRAMAAAGDGDMDAASSLLADAERLAAGLPADRHPVLVLMGPIAAGFGRGEVEPLERLIADPTADTWARAFATFSRAQIAENAVDRDRQRVDMRAAHDQFAALGDRLGLGMTLASLGDLESVAGAYDAAQRAFDEAIALAAELGNTDDLPQFETERARLLVRRGDIAAGRAELRRIAALPRLHVELVTAVHLYLADAARRAGDLDDARAELALTDLDDHGLGRPQRLALIAATGSAIARAAHDRDGAGALLAEAAEHAVESRDGPVLAMVAELAGASALADGAFASAAALLGVGAAQRGSADLGDPEVRACMAAVRAALGADVADAAIERARTLPRADGVALLERYARGGAAGSAADTGADAAVPDSASATSRA
jgi:tetratricopeptide (TPR) repeat protein